MTKVFIHADDFGVTMEQSKSIIECSQKGALNSISIIMNSPYAIPAYNELVRDAGLSDKIRAVIHLNFVEGKPCALSGSQASDARSDSHASDARSASDETTFADSSASHNPLSLLTDARGMFNCTYGKILKASFLSSKSLRAQYKEQFKIEIAAQLASGSKLLDTKTLSIDSHQHYHMIPVVYEALMEVVTENDYKIDYLRVPIDPATPIWSTPSLLFKMPPVNFIKWSLLKFLSTRRKSLERRHYSSISSMHQAPIFFGMPFTCQMQKGLVDDRLFKKYLKIAQKSGRDLELMFHPGAVFSPSDLLDSSQVDLVEFYSSENRQAEKDVIQNFDFT